MPQAATKRIRTIPILPTVILAIVAFITLLPTTTYAQTPNDTDIHPQEMRLPATAPNHLPSTGSGGLLTQPEPLGHPEALSLTASLIGAGLVAALAILTVGASHRARRAPVSSERT